MQAAFYGIARHIGTSANMAAVAAGLVHYCGCSVFTGIPKQKNSISEEIILTDLTDCGCSNDAEEIIEICDLLVLNLSVPNRELEDVYLRHSLVRKNVIFLFGKYYQNRSNEIRQLAAEYRIDRSRICMIPYNPGFGYAYETHRVSNYIKYCPFAGNYKDIQFQQQVKRAANAVLTYGNRKGEIYYG